MVQVEIGAWMSAAYHTSNIYVTCVIHNCIFTACMSCKCVIYIMHTLYKHDWCWGLGIGLPCTSDLCSTCLMQHWHKAMESFEEEISLVPVRARHAMLAAFQTCLDRLMNSMGVSYYPPEI